MNLLHMLLAVLPFTAMLGAFVIYFLAKPTPEPDPADDQCTCGCDVWGDR